MQKAVQQTVAAAFEEIERARLVDLDEIEFTESGDGLLVTIPVYAQEPLSETFADELRSGIDKTIKRPVQVRLVVLSTFESSNID